MEEVGRIGRVGKDVGSVRMRRGWKGVEGGRRWTGLEDRGWAGLKGKGGVQDWKRGCSGLEKRVGTIGRGAGGGQGEKEREWAGLEGEGVGSVVVGDRRWAVLEEKGVGRIGSLFRRVGRGQWVGRAG